MATFDDIATNQQMVNIANAIRAVTRTTESMTIPQMPGRLSNIKVIELSEAKVSFVSGSSVLLGKFATNISHLFIATPKTSADADLLSQVSLEIELAFDKKTGELRLKFNAPAEISDVTILVADMLVSSDDETVGFVVNSASGKIDGVTVNGEAQEVVNKIVNISVPVKTSDLLNDSDYVSDPEYVHTDNNYTTQEKEKLASLSNYDDTDIRGNIETLFTDVSTAEADIDKLESSVSTLQETVGANTSNISDLQRDLGTANSSIAQNTADLVSNSNAINEINEKIPTQANKNNQLADKDFVNSSINNLAAFYITKNAQRDPFETHAELFSATVFYSGGQPRVPTRNDYCIVRSDEEHENATTRYMYDENGWAFQYIVNETPLTAAQVAAINSGITEALVQQIGENTSARHTHTNKALLDTYAQTEENLSDAVAKKHSHSNKATLDATTASFTTEQQTKLAGVAERANKTVVDSALSNTSTNPVQNKVVSNALSDKASLTEQNTFEGKQIFNGEVEVNAGTSFNSNVTVADASIKSLDTNTDTVAEYKADKVTIEQGTSGAKSELKFPKVTGTLLADANVKQSTGTSTTDVMSQKAVTDALEKKFDKTGGNLSGSVAIKSADGTLLSHLNDDDTTDYSVSYKNDTFEFGNFGKATKLLGSGARPKYETPTTEDGGVELALLSDAGMKLWRYED